MSALWMAVVVLTAAPSDGAPVAAASTPAAANQGQQLKGYPLRDAVRAALRRWARPADVDASQAAREFLILYRELQADDQLAVSQREQLRLQVRNRLSQLSDQISSRLARERRQAGQQRPASVGLSKERSSPLAQVGGMGMGAGGMGRNVGAGFGGGVGAGGMGGGMNMPPDNGQALVDLIQTVISPKSWDINGGPGSIYYWRPGLSLVIRQTQEVHGQIGDMLEQMGRMQR